MSVAPIGQPGQHLFGAHLEKATTLVNDQRDRSRYDEAQVHATIAVALAVSALAQEVRGLRYHADNSDIVEAIDRLSRGEVVVSTGQADAFHYAGKVLDAAEAWHRGDKPATWEALDGVPIAHVVMAMLTLTSLSLEQVEQRTGVPATQMLRVARDEMLKGEHGDD